METRPDYRGRRACPVIRTQDLLAKKWSSLIIRELMTGTRRFGELYRSLGHLSTKTLTERLRELEAHGVVERRVYPSVPSHVEYTLTPKGRALWPILEAMRAWADTWT